MKVSFDFDATLSRKDVQDYAESLINLGIDVWICTSRMKDPQSTINSISIITKGWNDDLYAVSDRLGITREKILFTEMQDKVDILCHYDFIWHLDDDCIELNNINKGKIKTKGISVVGQNNWLNKCNALLYKEAAKRVGETFNKTRETYLSKVAKDINNGKIPIIR